MVVEGKTPEITIDQVRKLIASVGSTNTVKAEGQKPQEFVSVVGLWDKAIVARECGPGIRPVTGRR